MVAIKIRRRKFQNLDIADPFFDSLKADYAEFEDWFARKSRSRAFVMERDDGRLDAFLHVKLEEDSTTDIVPPIKAARIAKIATFKVNPKGTKRGERILRKAFDEARRLKARKVYVTVFEKYGKLIELFEQFGFRRHGKKETANGTEAVFVRRLPGWNTSPLLAFPYISGRNRKKYLLAIYPKFHGDLFPDSPLADQAGGTTEDVSHANTILKAYVAGLSLTRMKPGDIVVVYRTMDKPPAHLRSAATTICVVCGTRRRSDWPDAVAFSREIRPHSVFSTGKLREMYNTNNRLQVVYMTYNAVLPNPVLRGVLLEDVGITEQPRWDLRELTDRQFRRILELGGIDEGLVVD